MSAASASLRRPDAGFTVLEALIAFVILIGLMSGLMELASGSFRLAESVSRNEATIEAARSAMARLGHDIPLADGERDFLEGEVEIHVAMSRLDPDAADDGYADPFRITLTAANRKGGAPVTLHSIAIMPEDQEEL